MGWDQDRMDRIRQCPNSSSNHYDENRGNNVGWGIAFIMLGILSIPSVIGPLILIPLGVLELLEK